MFICNVTQFQNQHAGENLFDYVTKTNIKGSVFACVSCSGERAVHLIYSASQAEFTSIAKITGGSGGKGCFNLHRSSFQ